MYRFITLLFVILLTINLSAQRWKGERHTLIFGAGMTHFMGDLGGGSKDAAHLFGVRDLDFAATRPFLSAQYRFRVTEVIAVRGGFSWGILAADDKFSGSEGRKMRNLSFKTNLFQFSVHGEYYFLKEKSNPRYSFSSLHSVRNFSAYAFTGFSVNYFNPKAELDGTMYELQPLGTEGQGIGDNPAKYKKIALGLPIGLGAKYSLTKDLSIGLEISNTFTTSDYIDDAHDKYYDNEAIATTYGEIAARLADRHLDADGNPAEPYESGKTMRGNPNYNDAFILTVVTLTYKLRKDNSGLPKF